MIFLEQIVKQILMEEGQTLISLPDLDISWEKLEQLFIGTYEQAKGYITVYDWVNDTIGLEPQKRPNYTHIRHITYNPVQGMQRFMPDVPQQMWEFNPYTKNMSSLMNMNFSLEAAMYPTIGPMDYSIDLTDIKKGKKKRLTLPCIPSDDITCSEELDFDVNEITYEDDAKNDYLDGSRSCPCKDNLETTGLELSGDINGSIDFDTMSGDIKFKKDYDKLTMNFVSKYVGIKELDMNCELFYTWFKSNLLMMIGSLKSQIDLNSSGLPFDFNADGLLERAKELRTKVDELKINKSHWSNF